MKMTTRFSLLLLIAVLCTITLASAQDVLTPAPTAHHNAAGEAPQRFADTNRGGFSGDSVNRAMPGPWTFHLVAQLVKRPELNTRQVQVILDAISLLNSDLFASSSDTGATNAKVKEALQDLRRRALVVFPKNEIPVLFDNVKGGQAEQEILRKYYDLSALQLKGRKASFRRASANNKSELWRTHLVLYLINHPELNESQKETIVAAMSLATPDFFAVQSNSAAWKTKVREPSRSLEKQIVAAFPLEEAAKIFATLGDKIEAATPGPNSLSTGLMKSISYKPLGDSASYQQWTLTKYTQAVPENACTCSTVSDFCPIWSICRSNGCSETPSGCGTLWNYPCNGVCQ